MVPILKDKILVYKSESSRCQNCDYTQMINSVSAKTITPTLIVAGETSARTTVYIASNHSEESLISSSDEEHVDLLLGKKQEISRFIVSILSAGEKIKNRAPPLRVGLGLLICIDV